MFLKPIKASPKMMFSPERPQDCTVDLTVLGKGSSIFSKKYNFFPDFTLHCVPAVMGNSHFQHCFSLLFITS